MTSSPDPTDDTTDSLADETTDETTDAMTDATVGGVVSRPEPTVGSEPVRAVFRRAFRDMLVLVAVLAVVGIGIGALVADPAAAGVWAAVIGVAVTLVFSGSTVLAMLLTARSSVTAASGALVGSWIAKMLVLIIVFAALRDADFYDRGVFVTVVIVGVLGSVLLDYRAVARARVPYVEPHASA